MNPFRSLRDYEDFVYALPERYASILRSTLTVVRRGTHRADVTGTLGFRGEVRLTVYEYLVWDPKVVRIEVYGYEVWRGTERLFWYDSQPHPNDPSLASTHPHHKHIPPDIKHHRIPAPGLSFERPNLAFLIEEIERELLQRIGD